MDFNKNNYNKRQKSPNITKEERDQQLLKEMLGVKLEPEHDDEKENHLISPTQKQPHMYEI